MKKRLHLGRGAAILACTASLAGTAIAVVPTAASAAGTSCANKSIKIPQEGGKPIHIPVKAITVEGGATCAEATKVITGAFSSTPVSGWHYVNVTFPTPEGLLPQEYKKGSKVIKFAVRGG